VDCAGLLILAAGLRAWGTERLPLWGDELFTVYQSQLPLGFLVGAGAHEETNPPLYYLIMHVWIGLFGDSTLAMHVPPLIFASLTVLVVYLAANTLFDRGTARLAGMFAAVDPFWVMYGQEARCYALLCLIYGLAFLALAQYFVRRAGEDPLRPWLLLFTVALGVAVNLHFTALFFVAACFTVVGMDMVADWPPRRSALLTWLLVGCLTMFCIAFPLMLALGQTGAASIQWMPRLSLLVIYNFLASVLLSQLCWWGWVAWGCLALLMAAPILGAWRLRLSRPQWLLLLALPILFCGFLFAVSVKLPMVIPRVGIFLVMPVAILLARCIMSVRDLKLRWAVGAAGLAAWLVPLYLYYQVPNKEDWRAAAAVAAKAPVCDGPLMYVGYTGLGLIYYQPSLLARPLYSLAVDMSQGRLAIRRNDGARAVFNAAYLHAHDLQIRDAAGFVATHPHTMLTMPLVFQNVLHFLPKPKVLGITRGQLVVACY
jgi:4-amino-4-deoxy-L-arabinose transferase-like glycosyltransferase